MASMLIAIYNVGRPSGNIDEARAATPAGWEFVVIRNGVARYRRKVTIKEGQRPNLSPLIAIGDYLRIINEDGQEVAYYERAMQVNNHVIIHKYGINSRDIIELR